MADAPMKPVRVGLLGLGTVGCGTVNVLARNAGEITRRAGRAIEIEMAATRDLSRSRGCDTTEFQLVQDPMEVVENPRVDVVVELIGGEQRAKALMLRAINNHKHVVTANKALIAVHGNEIFAAAQTKNVMVAFEAAVGGGISIIKTIREGLAGNRIEQIAGIINGTANYVLTGMRDQGREFAEVLADAQRLGYAEANPSLDVNGVDAAHKLTILAAIAFGIPLQFDKVYTEGIGQLTRGDIKYGCELGYQIKHLGIARRNGNGIEMRVHPTLIPKRRLIANVDGVMNAILVAGDAVGPTLHYGAGAGADPTASAVVADIVDVVRALTTDPENRVPHLAFQPGALASVDIVAPDMFETAYFLSLTAVDKPGVLADVTRILGDLEISIEAILQKEPPGNENTVPVIILTQRTRERHMNQAVSKIEALDAITRPVKRIRVEHFND